MPGSKYVESSRGENRWEKALFVSQPWGILVPSLRTWFFNHPCSDQGWALLTDPQHHIFWDWEAIWPETQGLQPREQLCLCKQISQGPNKRSEELLVFSSLKNSTSIRHRKGSSKTSIEVISKGFCSSLPFILRNGEAGNLSELSVQSHDFCKLSPGSHNRLGAKSSFVPEIPKKGLTSCLP